MRAPGWIIYGRAAATENKIRSRVRWRYETSDGFHQFATTTLRIVEPRQDRRRRSTRLPEFDISLGLISTRLNRSTIPVVPIKTRRLVDYGTKFRRGIDLGSRVNDKYEGFARSLYMSTQVIEIAKRGIITRYLIIKYWWYEALVCDKAVIIFFFWWQYVRGYYVKSTKTRNRCFRHGEIKHVFDIRKEHRQTTPFNKCTNLTINTNTYGLLRRLKRRIYSIYFGSSMTMRANPGRIRSLNKSQPQRM